MRINAVDEPETRFAISNTRLSRHLCTPRFAFARFQTTEYEVRLLRALGMLRAHRGLLRGPAIDHIDIETPVRPHAKARDLPVAQESVNRSRMHTQMLRELSYGHNHRSGRRNAVLF
jgi:hypothetical protein